MARYIYVGITSMVLNCVLNLITPITSGLYLDQVGVNARFFSLLPVLTVNILTINVPLIQ